MKKVFLLSFFLLVNCVTQEIKPMSYKQSNVISLGTTGTCTLIAQFLQKYFNGYCDSDDLAKSVKVGLIAGIIAKCWTYAYTPKPLFENVKQKIAKEESYTIYQIIDKQLKDEYLLKAIELNYSKFASPLIKVFNELNMLENSLKEICKCLNDIISINDVEKEIKDEASSILAKFNKEYFDNIDQARITIKNHKDFYIQKNAFEQEAQRLGTLMIEQQIAWLNLQNSLNNLNNLTRDLLYLIR